MFGQRTVCCVWLRLVVLGTLLAITGPAAAVVVTFPDANLEAEVRDKLGIPAPNPITDTDMETMEWLSAGSSRISNIEGLQYATNLTSLNLYGNQISNISAVSGLTDLSFLWLHSNQISDISAVAGLTNLTNLLLCDNQISDISAISGLTNVHVLWLQSNQISNISAVSGLTNLESLLLHNNQISDIFAVAGLTNLTTLWLYGNQISDISAVSSLTNLTSLDLGNNQISDISVVSGLTNLIHLHLQNNQIETMSLSGADLSSLRTFHIAGNPFTGVLLADATFSQTALNALMDGGHLSWSGLAEVSGVLTLDMSDIDFAGISDFSLMYAMDDLKTLLLAGATNLGGSQVVSQTVELDALNWLDVTGLWDSFDTSTQTSLSTWDAIPGNTLVVPEPSTLVLLVIGGLALLGRRRP